MIISLFFAFLIGLTLGLMGAGGSILAIPILVIVSGYTISQSITIGYLVVGGLSFLATLFAIRKKRVVFKIIPGVILFSILGTYLGSLLLPSLPENIQSALFISLMLIVATRMILSKPREEKDDKKESKKGLTSLLYLAFTFVGILTSLLGVGGGFLIIPILTEISDLDIKKARGTSLAIITINCSSALFFAPTLQDFPWEFASYFSLVALAGMLLGIWLSDKIPARRLKKLFGFFILLLALVKIWWSWFQH